MALIPLFEAKTYLRVDSSDEDVLVGVLLSDPFPKKRTQSRIKKPNKMQR